MPKVRNEGLVVIDVIPGARKSLPIEVERRVPSNYRIVGWWRRAAFEVVEEWSLTISRTILIFFLARWWLILFQINHPGPQFLTAVFIIFLVYAFRIGFFEHMRWLREVYVVCEDVTSSGGSTKGRIYKFTGSHILQLTGMTERLSDAITTSWPSTYDKQSNIEKLWGWFTGEQMVRVTLVGPSEAYLTGRRVNPAFLKAIEKVQGGTPKKADPIHESSGLAMIDRILDVVERGIMPREEGLGHIRAILSRDVYDTEVM